jgi:ATPase family associated with various cellular activities (AAA)
MNPDEWERQNNAFLAALLSSYRQRLLNEPRETATGRQEERVQSPTRSRWHRKVEGTVVSTSIAEPVPPEELSSISSEEARPALDQLGELIGLSAFEREVLVLASAVELDPSFAELFARAAGNVACRYPTFALAMSMSTSEDAAWDAMTPHRPLRYLNLIEVRGGEGIVSAALSVPERVVNFLRGLNHLDAAIASRSTSLDVSPDVFPAASQEVCIAEIERVVNERPAGCVVNLVGADSASKHLVAVAAGVNLGRHLLRIPISNVPIGIADVEWFCRLWERERLLLPLALYIDASDDVTDASVDRSAVERVINLLGGLVILDSRDAWPRLPSNAAVIDIDRPTAAEQRKLWTSLLHDDELASSVAAEFDLDSNTIVSVARGQKGTPVAAEAGLRRDRLFHACRARCRPPLEALAERLEPHIEWDDLVVSSDVQEQLALIEQQVRMRATVHEDWGLSQRSNRGLGLTALFAGESGTGKTMAAEALATKLQMDLYRIDLSAVVSKYIGETEKNLRRLFDAAERGGLILFFDEADALFGKRSEVRDSHDRYANIEVSYLLQRMESHRGLAILATNLKRSLDVAFSRRLRFVVDFPFPSEEERARIWERSFPPFATCAGLDFGRLARLTLAGGAIRNVAVNASFAAAGSLDRTITMPLVLRAAQREYRKMGLPITISEFASEHGAVALGREPELAAVVRRGAA